MCAATFFILSVLHQYDVAGVALILPSIVANVLGLILGTLALGDVRKEPDLKGKGIAITGIVVSSLSFMVLVMVALAWFGFSQY